MTKKLKMLGNDLRLVRHGNSLALIFDKPMLDLLEINKDTEFSITTAGECLVLAPVRSSPRRKRLKSAQARGNRKYGKALKKLSG